MKKTALFIVLAALATLFASSCNKENFVEEFEVSTNQLNAKKEAETLQFTLKSNVKWIISDNAEWIELSEYTGSGNATVNVSLSENTGFEERTGEIKVVVNGILRETVTVLQSPNTPTRRTDSLALVDFYNATNGAGWLKNKWDLAKSISTWSGVTISDDRVTGLTIGAGVISSGTIPATLGYMDKLDKLSLANTNLSGVIPPEIYRLPELTNLALNNNPELAGDITKIMQAFKKLEVLNLMNNPKFTGTVPAEIGEITNLNTLYLSSTGVSGSIPAEIGNLPKLKIFGATSTNLNGTLPDIFDKTTALQLLQLNDCNLSGPLPKSLGKLNTSATSLSIWLYNNDFTGNIPEEWSGITTKCGQLRIQGNKLSGVVPKAVQKHTKYASWTPATYIYPQQAGYGLTAE